MGIFDAHKKKNKLTLAQQKENRMWDLWVEGKSVSPYTELMTYESEVNNGGHPQYFFNTANCHDLKSAVNVLFSVLPEILRENLRRGYEAFCRVCKFFCISKFLPFSVNLLKYTVAVCIFNFFPSESNGT